MRGNIAYFTSIILLLCLNGVQSQCSSLNRPLLLGNSSYNSIILSPSSPGNYPNGQTCEWNITTPEDQPGYMIRLDFDWFETESCCDFFQVYDGTSTSARLIGSYSGTTNPGIINSTGPAMYIRFITDGSITARGFQVKLGSDPACPNGHRDIYTPGQNILESTYYPLTYPNQENCEWHYYFNVGQLKEFIFEFDNVTTELGYDYVTIRVDGATIGNYTGSLVPNDVNVIGYDASVYFTSDGSVTHSGFRMKVTTKFSNESNGNTTVWPSTPPTASPTPSLGPCSTQVIGGEPVDRNLYTSSQNIYIPNQVDFVERDSFLISYSVYMHAPNQEIRVQVWRPASNNISNLDYYYIGGTNWKFFPNSGYTKVQLSEIERIRTQPGDLIAFQTFSLESVERGGASCFTNAYVNRFMPFGASEPNLNYLYSFEPYGCYVYSFQTELTLADVGNQVDVVGEEAIDRANYLESGYSVIIPNQANVVQFNGTVVEFQVYINSPNQRIRFQVWHPYYNSSTNLYYTFIGGTRWMTLQNAGYNVINLNPDEYIHTSSGDVIAFDSSTIYNVEMDLVSPCPSQAHYFRYMLSPLEPIADYVYTFNPNNFCCNFSFHAVILREETGC